MSNGDPWGLRLRVLLLLRRMTRWTGLQGKMLWDGMALLIVPLFIAGATLVFNIFELEKHYLKRTYRRIKSAAIFVEIYNDKGQLISPRRTWYTALWAWVWARRGFQGKTLWDWVSLLIVPLVIALAGWWLSEISTRNQQQIEDQRAQAEQRVEDDRARAAVLQSYIHDMTELLLNKQLATSGPNAPVRDIAQSSTLTAIRQLDADRKGVLLQFLHESDLIRETDPIISLNGADLSNANLSCFYDRFPGLPTRYVYDSAYPCANLNGADLSDASLDGANLSNADLSYANLFGANLSCVCLTDGSQRCADLSGADLSGADLSSSFLLGANLFGANLSGAQGWTNEQLAEAASLHAVAMPDGRLIIDPEGFKKRYGSGLISCQDLPPPLDGGRQAPGPEQFPPPPGR